MDYTSLNKEITKLAEYSKHLSSKHYVLEAIIGHAYNFVSQKLRNMELDHFLTYQN